jgi:hypothetical protein
MGATALAVLEAKRTTVQDKAQSIHRSVERGIMVRARES